MLRERRRHTRRERRVRARQAVQVRKRASAPEPSCVKRVARQPAGMQAAEPRPMAAETKASEMTTAHPSKMHSAATDTGAAKMHATTTEMHSAATAKVHTAATKVATATAEMTTTTATATAEMTTTTTAAAVSGLRARRCGEHCQRRQQDRANCNSTVFHEYLPGRLVNVTLALV